MPALTDKDLMPFGEHKDEKMEDVPAHYLIWIYRQGWLKMKYYPVYLYISENLESIKIDAQHAKEERSFANVDHFEGQRVGGRFDRDD